MLQVLRHIRSSVCLLSYQLLCMLQKLLRQLLLCGQALLLLLGLQVLRYIPSSVCLLSNLFRYMLELSLRLLLLCGQALLLHQLRNYLHILYMCRLCILQLCMLERLLLSYRSDLLLLLLLCRCGLHHFGTCKSLHPFRYMLALLLQHLRSRDQALLLLLGLQVLRYIPSSVCLLSNLFRYMLELSLRQLLLCGQGHLHNYLCMYRHIHYMCRLCNLVRYMLERLLLSRSRGQGRLLLFVQQVLRHIRNTSYLL